MASTRSDAVDPGDRDRLYEAVRARLRRYAADDVDAILSVDALKEVGALLDADDVGLDAARACGLLLWCRSLHQPDDADHDDLVPALALLEPVWRADPARVPQDIAEYFATVGAGPLRPTDAAQGPAMALMDHVKRTGDTAAAEIAVGLLRRIVAHTGSADPEYAMNLTNLAMAVQELAELTRSADGIAEAVALGRRAVAAFDRADPRRARPAAATAVALRRRSRHTGDLADLDEAIELGRAHAGGRADRLSNLGVALTYRYEWTGDRRDLDAAIGTHRAAVAATGSGDPRRAAHLANLAAALFVAFEDTGRAGDLDAAGEAAQAAASVPDVPDAVRSGVHSGLCNVLRARFRYTGNSADLDRAVEAGAVAVAALPEGHPDRAAALTNLGLARHVRSVRRAVPGDLDAAIAGLSAAVDATGAGDPDLAGRLSNLGDALLTRADRGGDALDRAVDCARAAARAGGDHRRRAYYLSNLGNAMRARGDVDAAIAVHQEAVDACAADAPHRAACLANLAAARMARFQAGAGPGDDLDRAIADASRAALAETGPVEVRVRAAVRWGYWAAAAGRWAEALAGYTAAVRLLGAVSPRDLPREDQEFELTRLGGVATDAAACALQAGDVPAAVRLLEQGRGIVLAHALPDGPPGASAPGAAGGSFAGPVAMLNVSRFRSDALLLTGEDVVVEPLPAVDPGTVHAMAERFLGAVDARDDGAAEEVLGWLWDVVAEPVLRRIGATGDGPPPRLWWCPTGLLAILPLHAAGRAGRGSVLDCVVSSTTPNLRALANARRVAPEGHGGGELLVVAPEDDALPAAAAEGRLLAGLFPGRVVTADLDPRTLAGYPRVHVAGHAVADLTNPSRGGIARASGPPVTAGELIRLRPVAGELMFLSACETARTSPALADETVHLASVLHVVGYRHVVATLWAVADRPALRVAEHVYRDLADHDDVERLPRALHDAVRALRARYPGRPLAWAAYVHIGP
ncbi:CHAT domain-containing protein [Dactylosporangium sp. CA-092794]|uniref:CHAT domain-containing protein n=1 Tax=Dactylosporangium sp. CA-092794 TaxID=3239929 RepID=UPI003D8D5201